jgi:hypothetical protein
MSSFVISFLWNNHVEEATVTKTDMKPIHFLVNCLDPSLNERTQGTIIRVINGNLRVEPLAEDLFNPIIEAIIHFHIRWGLALDQPLFLY